MAEAVDSQSKTAPIEKILGESEAIRTVVKVASTRVRGPSTFHLEGKPRVLAEPLGSNLIEVTTRG